MDNIDGFNLAAAFVFNELHSRFPQPIALDYTRASNRPDGVDQDLMNATVEWLGAEGIIRIGEIVKALTGPVIFTRVVLSNKGLQLLGATPHTLKGKSSYGAALREEIGKGALDAAKDLVKELLTTAIASGVAHARTAIGL